MGLRLDPNTVLVGVIVLQTLLLALLGKWHFALHRTLIETTEHANAWMRTQEDINRQVYQTCIYPNIKRD